MTHAGAKDAVEILFRRRADGVLMVWVPGNKLLKVREASCEEMLHPPLQYPVTTAGELLDVIARASGGHRAVVVVRDDSACPR